MSVMNQSIVDEYASRNLIFFIKKKFLQGRIVDHVSPSQPA